MKHKVLKLFTMLHTHTHPPLSQAIILGSFGYPHLLKSHPQINPAGSNAHSPGESLNSGFTLKCRAFRTRVVVWLCACVCICIQIVSPPTKCTTSNTSHSPTPPHQSPRSQNTARYLKCTPEVSARALGLGPWAQRSPWVRKGKRAHGPMPWPGAWAQGPGPRCNGFTILSEITYGKYGGEA